MHVRRTRAELGSCREVASLDHQRGVEVDSRAESRRRSAEHEVPAAVGIDVQVDRAEVVESHAQPKRIPLPQVEHARFQHHAVGLRVGVIRVRLDQPVTVVVDGKAIDRCDRTHARDRVSLDDERPDQERLCQDQGLGEEHQCDRNEEPDLA